MTASSQNEFEGRVSGEISFDINGVAWRNPDDGTTGLKFGKSTWPGPET